MDKPEELDPNSDSTEPEDGSAEEPKSDEVDPQGTVLMDPLPSSDEPADPQGTVLMDALPSSDEPPAPPADPQGTVLMDALPSSDAPPPDPQGTVIMDPLPSSDAPSAPPSDIPAGQAADADEEDSLVGQVLRGKWKVLKQLGAGSFGTVYKIEDIKGGWIEALKVLGVDRLTGAEAATARERFLREAQIMKRLGNESQHIVGLSTYEEDLEAGMVYFVMEFVEGQPLSDLVEENGPVSMERTITLSLQACDALTVAHEGPDGVVHRDLKLENLMLTKDRTGDEIVKILDFGIAKIAERETDSRLTTVGTLGTPGYAAPEQLRAEAVDARTDLFAFGVILYALLTGKDPWLGNPAHEGTHQIYDLMVQTEKGAVIPFEDTGVDVPPAMQNVVMKLLRRDPEERFQSARELKQALQRILAGGTDVDACSLRVLSDEPGVAVQVRAGRKVVAEGPTPLVANGLTSGSFRVAVTDERFEATTVDVDLAAGAIEDVRIVTNARKQTVGAAVGRKKGPLAAVAVLALAAAGAFVLKPWGVTLQVEDLQARAASGEVQAARVTADGIVGSIPRGPLATPFRVDVPADGRLEAIRSLRASGVDIDASFVAGRLIDQARSAQAALRYFGDAGNDVLSFAEQAALFDPDNDEARSLLLKVGERMAWDAAAASAEGETERADELISGCLEAVPGHPRCTALRDGG